MHYLLKELNNQKIALQRQEDAKKKAGELDSDVSFLQPKWGNYNRYTVVDLYTAVCLSERINPDHEFVRRGWTVDIARYAKGAAGTALKNLLERYDFALLRATKQDGDLQTVGDRRNLDLMAFAAWARQNSITLPVEFPSAKAENETRTASNARRYQMCIDARLAMPDTTYANLPDGIGKLATRENISKQAFSKSVKEHIATLQS